MNTTARPVLDVAHLPENALDHRSPVWWGNLWLLVIESTIFALLIASYFYIRMNYTRWPPPRVNQTPVLYNSNPDLLIPSISLLVLLGLCVPVFYMDRASLRIDRRGVNIGLAITILLGVVTVLLRFREFSSIHFKWNDNAYASVVWMILGTHLTHLIVATLECVVMGTWSFTKPLDESHARDIHLTAIYWYWIAGTWVILHAICYWVPRFI